MATLNWSSGALNGYRSGLSSMFQTTETTAQDRQLLTDVSGYIDMRRSSTKCKMSLSFRYVFLSCLDFGGCLGLMG